MLIECRYTQYTNYIHSYPNNRFNSLGFHTHGTLSETPNAVYWFELSIIALSSAQSASEADPLLMIAGHDY